MRPAKTNTFKTWLKEHRRFLLIIIGVLLIGAAGAAAYYILTEPTPPAETISTIKSVKKPEPPAPKYYSPLTGVEVADEANTKKPVNAVMIENSPDARPQSGLKEGDVIYEAIAEGGITRFLVLYQQGQPELIGPVRSLRMYYVDWLAPYNASVAHVGGSADALQEIRNGEYRDIDQFFNGAYYWRSSDRYPPHNVYTSSEKLNQLNAAKGYTESNPAGFKRKDTKPGEPLLATKLNVKISWPLYNSSYTYNHETGSYERFQARQPHLDREKGQISPKVVIVMKVEQSRNYSSNREPITTEGSGEGVVFQDGNAKEVIWSKDGRKNQLVFHEADSGKDMELARGQTWIVAIPKHSGAVSWE